MFYLIHQHDHLSRVLAALLSRSGAVLRQWSGEEEEPKDLYQARGLILGSGLAVPEAVETLAGQLRRWAERLPLLALGHSALAFARAFGLRLQALPQPWIAENQRIIVGGGASPVFRGVPRELNVCCYLHQCTVPGALPNDLVALARDAQDRPLALRHVRHSATALLFHPAAEATEQGERMLSNWLNALQ